MLTGDRAMLLFDEDRKGDGIVYVDTDEGDLYCGRIIIEDGGQWVYADETGEYFTEDMLEQLTAKLRELNHVAV